MEKLTTNRPDEFAGEVAVDYTPYWEKWAAKHIDTSKWSPRGFAFDVNNRGDFSFRFIASPVGITLNEGISIPVKEIETNVTWEEFSTSFVLLKVRALYGRGDSSSFHSIE